MNVKVLLFAEARERVGKACLEIELDSDTSVGDLKRALAARFPELSSLVDRSAISVDQEYAADELTLHHQSEVAVIPPVSGG